ncbi:disease resistance protein RGA2-like [Ananas comosus]|uniref:Disease resistance protein RGA2-like n=1 Tax=Ananas comosus TaxID=4615 RepID=A0A6P5EXW2_ANACO|nr:disease resistance protein RGA2-like [Ananas comosus]
MKKKKKKHLLPHHHYIFLLLLLLLLLLHHHLHLLCLITMAELTILGWFATPIIEAMVHKAHSYISNHLHLHPCMEDDDELRALESTLTQILSVVSVAESLPIAVNSASHHRALLRQLRDAAYEAEDLLDEFGYLLLRAKVESKIMVLLSPPLADKFRHKLKKILKKLDRVNASAERLLHVVGLENGNPSITSASAPPQQHEAVIARRATSSFLLENQVFGRDKEQDEMLKLLLERDSRTGLVISVIGDGGVGKTTLAQIVYNDRRVADRFDLRMWVCVSENFDLSRLTREILLSACDDANGCLLNLDKLQEQLKKRVASKRFLLVLDDVWNDERIEEWENKDRWRKLLAPLRFGGRGSKIIVTTRLKMVARMLDAENSIHLKGLGEDDFWLLFKKHAFGSAQHNENSELQEVGKQIVEKLQGSPLGAKVVGGILNTEMSVENWKRVLRSPTWDGIMPVLRLSYRNLPSHLQRCFAYCSIFPKDWKFEPDSLIYMWMGQGFLRPEEGSNTRMEEVGRIYFFDLLARSFFQILEHNYTTYYVMHDMIHDLAQSVSKEECFRIEGSNEQKIPSTVRHLSINTDVLTQLEKS